MLGNGAWIWEVEMAIFYSFHYQRDSWRIHQLMNMGAVEDGYSTPNRQEWEQVKAKGDQAIRNWIDSQMAYKRAVVVLVGKETAGRRWVDYEIRKAWDDKRPLVGIRINGLKNAIGQVDPKGANPFDSIFTQSGYPISNWVNLHDPTGYTSDQVYASIRANLLTWIANAYKRV